MPLNARSSSGKSLLSGLSTLLLILLVLAQSGALSAQSYVLYSEVPVLGLGGMALKNPWAGGLNNPQFSQIDADGDGQQDLFVFDRQGNVPMIFLADGSSGAEGWTYSPYWSGKFPPLYAWAILRDLNCDGLPELISSRLNGIAVYTASRSGGLSFEIDTQRLRYVESGFTRFLGVLDFDVPAFEDVDGDGDRDILTFNLGGGYVEWYKNRAAENGDPCGPLDFELVDKCWGRFYESGINKAVSLDTCNFGRPAPDDGEMAELRSGVHAGSTLMAFDEDGDGDLELVLGDLSFDNLNRLHNGGTPENALITAQDTVYPAYDVPYLVHQYPAAFYVDADQDGRPDMLVSPNSVVLGRDINNVAFYKDVGTGAEVIFERQREDFLVGGMIDVGRGANPVFFDYDGDGLLDLVIGNSSYTLSVGNKVSQLALYRNTGTATAPSFELISNDFAGLGFYGFENIHPAFGDVDGDGDLDLVIGEEEGMLHLFVNNPVGGVAQFSLAAPGWQGIDVGKTSTPFLVDIDRDGDLDLLIGERNGNLNYYRNDGDASTAGFTLVSELFGGIALRSGPTNIGEIQPWVIEDPENGEYRLYIGERTGRVWRYDNWESDLGADFLVTDSVVGGIDVGDRSRVALADLNGDGNFEMVIGNMRGGLNLYKEGIPEGISVANKPAALNTWPNPASGRLWVKDETGVGQVLGLSDARGLTRMQTAFVGPVHELDISAIPPGWYQVWLQSSSGRKSASLLVMPAESRP